MSILLTVLCGHCGEKVPNVSPLEEGPYHCPYCKQKFDTRAAVLLAIAKKSEPDAQSRECCDMCRIAFALADRALAALIDEADRANRIPPRVASWKLEETDGDDIPGQ